MKAGMMIAAGILVLACTASAAQKNGEVWYDTAGIVARQQGQAPCRCILDDVRNGQAKKDRLIVKKLVKTRIAPIPPFG